MARSTSKTQIFNLTLGHLKNDPVVNIDPPDWWNDQDLDYTIEDGYILCNETGPLDFVYVYDIMDVTKFSPKFIICFSYRLAQFSGYEITGSQAVVQAMEQLFTKELSTAASIQGQNRPPKRIQRSRLRSARMNTGTSRNWRNWGPD